MIKWAGMAIKVSIQGDRASFHDIAANQFFGDNSQRLFCDTFADTIEALKKTNC